MIWLRYKATNIPISHILNKNSGDTPKTTAQFKHRPGQEAPTAAAVAAPARGWRQAGRMPGGAGEAFLHTQRTLRSWMGLRGQSWNSSCGARSEVQVSDPANEECCCCCRRWEFHLRGVERERQRLFSPLENPAYNERYRRVRMLEYDCLCGFHLVVFVHTL